MTPKQRLLLTLYPEAATYVPAAIAEGRSWREVAVEVSAASGVTVSHESLRQWFGSEVAA